MWPTLILQLMKCVCIIGDRLSICFLPVLYPIPKENSTTQKILIMKYEFMLPQITERYSSMQC
jgi:hypothetical protein